MHSRNLPHLDLSHKNIIVSSKPEGSGGSRMDNVEVKMTGFGQASGFRKKNLGSLDFTSVSYIYH